MTSKGTHSGRCVVAYLLMVGLCSSLATAAYDPPIGIPAPPFGIDESHTMYTGQTYDFGSGAVSYPDNGNGPYTHYVDNTHPSATDTGNPYGTPTIPRKSPTGITAGAGGIITLGAGSVMEIHGGPYATNYNPKIIGQGTAANPVIVRGADPVNRVEFTGLAGNDQIFYIEGSYLILENIRFSAAALVRIAANSDHLTIRNCEVDNTGFGFGGRGAAVVVGSYAEYCVVYNNNIHHNAKTDLGKIDDLHGTSTGTGSSYIWFLNNEIHHNSGDAFQALHYATVPPHHIYLGRNVMHDDRENGIDLKTIDDIVISENIMYNYAPSETSLGDAVVFGSNGYNEEFGPLRVSFLFNEIYNSGTGLRVEGVEDCWIVGNTFHDIDGNAIMLDIDGDSDNVNIIHNTITSTGGDGIHHHWLSGATNINILGNIISDIGDSHIEIALGLLPAFTIENNLFYQNGGNVEVELGNTFYRSQSASTYNALSGWANNVIGDPDFADAAADDYQIGSSSAGIDVALETTAYDDFYTLYSIDISVDNAGAVRPQGFGWDIGAYEFPAPTPEVMGRYVFYNNSAWDGNAPAANASDDAAIATDKTALVDGQVAGYANYTSYFRGINAIMVDATLTGGTASASDFVFKVGNDSTPSGWSAGPAPTSVTIRAGAGDGASDRITVTFADGAIIGEWLEVTYIPTGDVFYFGNAPGETGNPATDAQVTPTDEVYVRNNPATLAVSSALISHAGDFNRDKKVGPTDMVICRNNGTNSSTALKLIKLVDNTAPTVLAGADDTITLPIDTVSLDATVTDDGLPDPPADVTTTWTKLSGTGTVTFGNANAIDTTATFSTYDTYVLRLTANDNELTTYDEVTITVNRDPSLNYQPEVDAGPDQSIDMPDSATLDATVIDDGKPISPGVVTYAWSKFSGSGTVTFGDSSAVDTTASFSVADSYVLRLTADDSELMAYDDITITVNPAPVAFQETGGMVVMEAENFSDNDTVSSPGPWQKKDSPLIGFVGSWYMGSPWAAATTTWDTGCKMSYWIDFVTPGTYNVWMYVNYDGHSNNHCFIGMDGTALPEFGSATFNSWHWHNEGQTIDVTAGTHAFDIVSKEKYFYVDRIILTTDGSFTPSGTGPAESTRQ